MTFSIVCVKLALVYRWYNDSHVLTLLVHDISTFEMFYIPLCFINREQRNIVTFDKTHEPPSPLLRLAVNL